MNGPNIYKLENFQMTTLDIEIALMQHYNVRQNIIVPNVSWGMGLNHECDLLILRKSGLATEIEIKISKQDLLKDKQKPHKHFSQLISKLYFAVPEKLEEFALENIQKNAGLLVLKKRVSTYSNYEFEKIVPEIVKSSVINKSAFKWSNEQRYNLARLGTMRILSLKKKLNK